LTVNILAWPLGRASDLNPYVSLMYGAMRAPRAFVMAFEPKRVSTAPADVFHIQWPETIFEGRGGKILPVAAWKARCVLATASKIKQLGGKVVLTIHNATPHANLSAGQKLLWTWYFGALLDQTDHLIGLSATSIQTFVAANPRAHGIATTEIQHPHYRTVYQSVPQACARAATGLPAQGRLIGILGTIRPSKRVPEAITIFRQLRSDDSLLIWGQADDLVWAQVVAAATGSDRVILRRGTMSDDELSTAISAVDAVLINQAATLNSGTALLALSLGRRVIAPAVGSLVWLRQLAGSAWVRLFDLPLTAIALRLAIQDLPASEGIGPDLSTLDPAHVSGQLLALFEALKSPPLQAR
jgi:beta-1,4-mannosyltransferase